MDATGTMWHKKILRIRWLFALLAALMSFQLAGRNANMAVSFKVEATCLNVSLNSLLPPSGSVRAEVLQCGEADVLRVSRVSAQQGLAQTQYLASQYQTDLEVFLIEF